MAKYRVIAASVNIHAGVLGLEPHQARARLHRLKPLGGNRYDVIDPPVAFKRGEMFEYEGELPKQLVEMVACFPTYAFPVIDADLAPPDDGVAEPLIDADLVPDLIEDGPDDGVSEPPRKLKKGSRGAKPAA